jgi:hypothetical protein
MMIGTNMPNKSKVSIHVDALKYISIPHCGIVRKYSLKITIVHSANTKPIM